MNNSSKSPIQARPVVLCGGSGARLWPLSRSGFPKQFLCLTGDQSLFQQATIRLMDLGNDEVQMGLPYIVTSEDHRFLVLEQLREMGVNPGAALLEPVGKNTAPALTLAALAAIKDGEDPVLVVTPADQMVIDTTAFTATMRHALVEAASGNIVILGIKPDRLETGYGYIKAAVSRASSFDVERFIEKPDAETAQIYLDEDGYYWNAGIFLVKASVWLEALTLFRPDIARATIASWDKRTVDEAFTRPGKAEFMTIPSESIDYAVMERVPGSVFPIRMVPLDAGWSDLGVWDAVWGLLPKDEHGNAHSGDVLTVDTRDTLVHATSRLVSLVGVDNLIVVETPDAVLVVDKTRSQDVKQLVSILIEQKREEHTAHRKVHRPWGWYDTLHGSDRFKVKLIEVRPGASLSLQKHRHRAEHWVVVKGTAEIVCGDKKLLLTENQSTYIPLGEVHRLVNPGNIPLEIVEVQSGSYLGEDDIVRLEDYYGRKRT